eukprot:g11982.t1
MQCEKKGKELVDRALIKGQTSTQAGFLLKDVVLYECFSWHGVPMAYICGASRKLDGHDRSGVSWSWSQTKDGTFHIASRTNEDGKQAAQCVQMVMTKFGQIADFRFTDDEAQRRAPFPDTIKSHAQKTSLAYLYSLQALARAFLPPGDKNSIVPLRMDDCNTIWRRVDGVIQDYRAKHPDVVTDAVLKVHASHEDPIKTQLTLPSWIEQHFVVDRFGQVTLSRGSNRNEGSHKDLKAIWPMSATPSHVDQLIMDYCTEVNLYQSQKYDDSWPLLALTSLALPYMAYINMVDAAWDVPAAMRDIPGLPLAPVLPSGSEALFQGLTASSLLSNPPLPSPAASSLLSNSPPPAGQLGQADNHILSASQVDEIKTPDSFPTPESLFHRDNVTLDALPDPPNPQGKAKNFSWTEQKLFDLTTAYYEQKNTNKKKQSVNWNIFAHYYSMASRYCWHKADIKDVFKRDKESLRQRCKDNSKNSKKRKRP